MGFKELPGQPAAIPLPPRGFRFNLVTPTIFGACPFETMLGIDVLDFLGPFLREGETMSKTLRGRSYPCILNDGEQIMIPLGQWGLLGFRTHGGHLVVYMPPSLSPSFEGQLTPELRGKRYVGSLEGAAVHAYVLHLGPGSSIGVTVPALGDVRIAVP